VILAICTGDDGDIVDIQETATVNGVMDGGAGTDTLTFHFLTPADLAGQTPASGTVTHNGLTYTWRNFETLEALQSLVSIGDVSQAEGTGGSTTFTFVLTRSGDLPAGSVLASTADGSAVSPGDFAAQTNVPVTFIAGQSSANFDVTVVADPDVEPDEGFQVVLSSPTGMEIADGTGDGTILNDDVVSTVSIADLSQAEGNGGFTTFTFTLSRTGGLQAGSVLASTVDGSATSPGQFTPLTNFPVNFAAGQVNATVDVMVVGDATVEPDQTFQVVLSSPSANLVIGDGTADATIVDDDAFIVAIPVLGGFGQVLLVAALCAAALLVLRRASQ
jgi:hypothetical protein